MTRITFIALNSSYLSGECEADMIKEFVSVALLLVMLSAVVAAYTVS